MRRLAFTPFVFLAVGAHAMAILAWSRDEAGGQPGVKAEANAIAIAGIQGLIAEWEKPPVTAPPPETAPPGSVEPLDAFDPPETVETPEPVEMAAPAMPQAEIPAAVEIEPPWRTEPPTPETSAPPEALPELPDPTLADAPPEIAAAKIAASEIAPALAALPQRAQLPESHATPPQPAETQPATPLLALPQGEIALLRRPDLSDPPPVTVARVTAPPTPARRPQSAPVEPAVPPPASVTPIQEPPPPNMRRAEIPPAPQTAPRAPAEAQPPVLAMTRSEPSRPQRPQPQRPARIETPDPAPVAPEPDLSPTEHAPQAVARPRQRPKPRPTHVAPEEPSPEVSPDREAPIEKTVETTQETAQETPPDPDPAEPQAAPASLSQAATSTAPSETDGVPSDAARQRTADETARWHAAIRAAIETRKRYPRQARGRDGVAIVSLILTREGRLAAARLKRRSGHPALDRAAMAAVEGVRSWPPAPAGLSGSQFSFDIPIHFQR